MRKALFLRLFCAAVIPLILLLLYFSAFKMYYMDAEYPLFSAQSDYISREHENRVIILGDSRAKAGIIPSVLGEKAYNLSLGGTTPIEMYYSLKNYLKNSPAPEKIVISFAPQHYYRNDCFWERSVYFHYLSVTELKEVLKNARATSSPVYYEGCEEDAIKYYLYSPGKYSSALLNSLKEDRAEKNLKTYSTVIADMGYKLYGKSDGSSDINFEATEKQFYVDPLDDLYLGMLFELCISAGADTWLVQIPINESSYRATAEEYSTGFTGYMQEISERYPGVYVQTDMPCYPDEYFGDSSHLSRRGAQLYSEYLRELLG